MSSEYSDGAHVPSVQQSGQRNGRVSSELATASALGRDSCVPAEDTRPHYRKCRLCIRCSLRNRRGDAICLPDARFDSCLHKSSCREGEGRRRGRGSREQGTGNSTDATPMTCKLAQLTDHKPSSPCFASLQSRNRRRIQTIGIVSYPPRIQSPCHLPLFHLGVHTHNFKIFCGSLNALSQVRASVRSAVPCQLRPVAACIPYRGKPASLRAFGGLNDCTILLVLGRDAR